MTLGALKGINIQPAVQVRQAIGSLVNVLKNDMPFLIDPVAGSAKYSSLAGSAEEVAAAVSEFFRRWMKKMAGYAPELTTDEGHIGGD